MVTIKSEAILLLLALIAPRSSAALSSSGSNSAASVINIATVVSNPLSENSTSSSSEELPLPGESNDFVLVGNTTTADAWLDAVAGYSAAGDSRILYQTANWALLEDGAQHETFSSFWARFQAANSTATSLTICTMVANWESDSLSEDDAALAAVEVENRLKSKCDENDTIALAFTAPVEDTVVDYLEGEVAVNDAAAPIPLQGTESSKLEASEDRLFVRLANNVCTGDEAIETSSLTAVNLLTGEYCSDPSLDHGSNFMPPHVPREDHDNSDNSGWKDDLKFVIPVGVCIFLLGCAGLAYAIREKKKNAPETPKDDGKGMIDSLPYAFTMHPVV